MDVTPGVRRVAAPDLESVGQDDELVARMAEEIERDGPITFARFMELALYDPIGGYYRSEAPRPGRDGDFLTAPETHPIFGWAVSRGIDEIWQRLDRPEPFTIREYGAGTGAFADAIFDRLERDGSALAEAVTYAPVEIDSRRLTDIRRRFEEKGRADRLLGESEAGAAKTVGVILGNEILDALPTHRVVGRAGSLQELRVGWREGRFVEVEAPPTPGLAERLVSEGIELVEGQRGEVCLAIGSWIEQAAAGLDRGVLFLIDYGHVAVDLYDPVRRREGTLRAYIRQRVHDDPFRHVGRQDLTAHVDVTAVERAAAEAGLVHLGTTSQAEFLIGLDVQDLLQEIQADPTTGWEEYLEVRSGLMRLLDPAATGGFRVMAFGRGLPGGPPLRGLAYRLRG